MEQYLTTKEVQVLLNVSRGTLNNWRKAKKIKAKKIHGTVRYKLSDIEKSMK
jgi:excisionase family DNA binding protein